MILIDLFLGFLKVGCFTFGGGYAAIPLIRDLVLRSGWLTEERFTYMIAVSESTPGPIMVNLATYVGSSQAGLPGALLSTFAVVLPSFCIILLIYVVLKSLIKQPAVQAVLGGMQQCVVGIILATGIQLTAKSVFPAGCADFRAAAIALLLGAVIFLYRKKWKKKLSPIRLILLSAVLGILLYGA